MSEKLEGGGNHCEHVLSARKGLLYSQLISAESDSPEPSQHAEGLRGGAQGNPLSAHSAMALRTPIPASWKLSETPALQHLQATALQTPVKHQRAFLPRKETCLWCTGWWLLSTKQPFSPERTFPRKTQLLCEPAPSAL